MHALDVPDWLELAFIALAALAGSGFMWLLMTAVGLPYLVPRVLRKSIRELGDLSQTEIDADGGNVMQAFARKQSKLAAESFAHSFDGALGKVVAGAPTDKLDALARQYGYEDASDAAGKLVGTAGGPDGGAGLGGALQALQGAGLGKSGSFTRIIELVTALQALSQFGGAGGLSGMPGLASGGSAQGRTW